MFLDQLSRISNRIEGAVALSLVAKDGMPVESLSSDPDLDLDVLAAELVAQARVDQREPPRAGRGRGAAALGHRPTGSL